MSIEERARRIPQASLDEKTSLRQWIAFYRATLVNRCAGLNVEQLTRRSIPSSELTLLGLLRHMSAVEQYWFPHILRGDEVDWYYDASDDPDLDFHDLQSVPLEVVLARLDEAVARSDAIIDAHSLDDLALKECYRGHVSLRWILAHLLEEYARHCGHADLLREAIDGMRGY